MVGKILDCFEIFKFLVDYGWGLEVEHCHCCKKAFFLIIKMVYFSSMKLTFGPVVHNGVHDWIARPFGIIYKYILLWNIHKNNGKLFLESFLFCNSLWISTICPSFLIVRVSWVNLFFIGYHNMFERYIEWIFRKKVLQVFDTVLSLLKVNGKSPKSFCIFLELM